MTKPGREIRLLTVVAVLLLSAQQVFAQALPQTDIWLASISNGLPGVAVKINPTIGYNNQPHFSADGSVIFYTREIPGNGGAAQTDIAAFSIETVTTRMVAETAESEYSPTPIPGRNALSVIQVEPDQKQRLWAINIDNGELELLLPDVEPVGYHDWLSEHAVAIFILGESFTLHTATLGTAGSKEVADNIGRTIRKHPQNGEVLYVDKNTEPWQIAAYTLATNNSRSVMPLFPAGVDFTVDGEGNYSTGNGSRLYRRAPGDVRWKLVADYSAGGVRNISRLAVNPAGTKITFVGNHPVP